jgi:hypothetical protein
MDTELHVWARMESSLHRQAIEAKQGKATVPEAAISGPSSVPPAVTVVPALGRRHRAADRQYPLAQLAFELHACGQLLAHIAAFLEIDPVKHFEIGF